MWGFLRVSVAGHFLAGHSFRWGGTGLLSKAECPQALGTKENNHTKYNNTIHAPYRKHMYMDCDYIELKKVLKENHTLKTTYGYGPNMSMVG